MDRFEQRIRAARPAVPELGPQFSAQVLAEIARRGLRVRPAWQVRSALWLGRAAALGALGVAVLLLNGAAFELRSNGALELLAFGTRLLGGFLADLPWDLLLSALLLAGAAGWGLRHAQLARVPVAWAVLIGYGLTGAGGLALAGSGLNESVQSAVLEDRAGGLGLQWFYAQRAMYRRPHPHFRMGRVIALEGQRAQLQTPAGEVEEVMLPQGFRAQVGDAVRLIVAPDGPLVRAQAAQLCNPSTVGPYFRHHRMMQEMMQRRGMGAGMGGMGPGMGRGMGPGMHRGMGGGMGPGVGPMQQGAPPTQQ
jgi:hypothetical protein